MLMYIINHFLNITFLFLYAFLGEQRFPVRVPLLAEIEVCIISCKAHFHYWKSQFVCILPFINLILVRYGSFYIAYFNTYMHLYERRVNPKVPGSSPTVSKN